MTRVRGSIEDSYKPCHIWSDEKAADKPYYISDAGKDDWRRRTGRTMTDVTTPNFASRVRSGKLPVNPMSSHSITIQADNCNIAVERYYTSQYGSERKAKVVASGGAPIHSGHTTVIDTPDLDALVTEALARANTARWDVLTFASEFGKTLQLVLGARRRALNRAQEIAALVRRRNKGRASLAEAWQHFSEMWLEYRYGWRVLMYDLQSAEESYQALSHKGEKIVRATSSETLRGNLESPWSDKTRAFEGRFVHDETLVARGFVGVEYAADPLVTIDPFVTAWELVPFSFVSDWFVNIGSNIAAYSPFVRGKVSWAGASVKRSTISNYVLRSGTFANYHGLSVPETTVMSRTSEINTRVPKDPSFGLSFNPNLNLAKMVDLATLAKPLSSMTMSILRG